MCLCVGANWCRLSSGPASKQGAPNGMGSEKGLVYISIMIHCIYHLYISKNPDNLSTLSISYVYYIYIYTRTYVHIYIQHIYIYIHIQYIYIYTLFIYTWLCTHIFISACYVSLLLWKTRSGRAFKTKAHRSTWGDTVFSDPLQGASMALCWNRCLENIFQSYGLMFCDLCLCKWIVFLFFWHLKYIYIYIIFIYIYIYGCFQK